MIPLSANYIGKILLIVVLFFTVIGLISNLHNSTCTDSIVVGQRKRHSSTEEKAATVVDDDSKRITFHPFENTCKFPLPNFYASDITAWRIGERLRTLNCPVEYPFATQDLDGHVYVHPHFNHYPNITKDVYCKVIVIEGGLRNKKTNKGKDDFKEVATFDAPQNKRFWVNSDAFYIRCFDKNKTVVWEKPYAGLYDREKPKNKISLVPDLPSFTNFGAHRRKKENVTKSINRYSIDILGFDSTSRTMFYRHLPKTVEVMEKLGYETLYGYNKVGDNSGVNLVPILAGDLKEALEEPKLDNSSDINADWILPTNRKMDPTLLPFLWKTMKEFGCESMLNEDISMKALGLFHYPRKEFLPGFTEQPADHFFRTFYLAVYKNWKYGPCRDGTQIQKIFLDIWHRFASKYKDKCHFGFTFITTLTHEAGQLLELLDTHLSQRLENLYLNGALDNTVSVIMGDHGNRIGLVQYSYTGRIEERMPLMAIRIPVSFRKKHPELYRNFLENKYKLTSNFDVHQMLKDFTKMEFGGEPRKERGISLLRPIPKDRTCFDAYIPENFCTCLVDKTNDKILHKNIVAKSKTHRLVKSLSAIKVWLRENGLSSCIDMTSLDISKSINSYSLNGLARHGLRNKNNVTVTEQIRNNPNKCDYLHHEVSLSATTVGSQHEVHLLFRLDDEIAKDEFLVVFEPLVQKSPENCQFKSIFDVCQCLESVP